MLLVLGLAGAKTAPSQHRDRPRGQRQFGGGRNDGQSMQLLSTAERPLPVPALVLTEVSYVHRAVRWWELRSMGTGELSRGEA
jgi:hypothetical protein